MAEKISEEQKQGKDDPSSKEETRFADKGRSMKDVLMEDYDGQMYKEIVGLFTEKRTWLDSELRNNTQLRKDQIEQFNMIISHFDLALELMPAVYENILAEGVKNRKRHDIGK